MYNLSRKLPVFMYLTLLIQNYLGGGGGGQFLVTGKVSIYTAYGEN